jgi:hypothetical protein
MQYVTYLALIGAAYAKQIVIEIKEHEIQRSMQIEQQEFNKLINDPELKAAAEHIGDGAARMLAKDQAKLITHQRGILMPAVRALKKAMNASLLSNKNCNKRAFENCLSARPEPINPVAVPHDWNRGRLNQCSYQTGCKIKWDTFNDAKKRKFRNDLEKKGERAEEHFEDLAETYEEAYE